MTRAPRPTVISLPDAIRVPLATVIGADLRSVRVHIGAARHGAGSSGVRSR